MADTIQIDLDINNSKALKALGEVGSDAKLTMGQLIEAFALGELAVDALKEAINLTVETFKKAVDAASEYDNAVNSLNVAIAANGAYTQEASKSFQDYAASIQETTKYSENQVLSSAALLSQMTSLTDEGLKKATSAALELSAAYKIDLDSATRLVGRAAEGNITALNRMGISVQKGINDAQTYSNALAALSRLQGTAAASAGTYQGSLAMLGHSFDDVFKEIGKFFTQSPAIIATFNTLSELFKTFSGGLKGSNTDFFKDIIVNFSLILESGVETSRQIGLSFELAYLRATEAWYAFKVATTLGLSDTFNKQLNDVMEKIDQVKASFSQDSVVTTFFDNLIAKVQETSGHLQEFGGHVVNMPVAHTVLSWGNATSAFASQFQMSTAYAGMNAAQLEKATLQAKTKMVADFQQMGLAARNGLGTAAGAGFAAFGKALATGQNALKAFAQAMIGSIGQACIQEGTSMILRGMGYSLDPLMAGFGPGLISAGAALAAFGGVLSAVGGGGGAAGGGGGGGGGGGAAAGPVAASAGPSASDASALQDKKPHTTINVHVQGNILDRRQTGLELAAVIQDTFGTNGINYNTGAS